MSVYYTVEITRRQPEALVSQSAFNRAMRWSMGKAGMLWIDKYLPMHFEAGAAGRYGFSPRPIPYDVMKERITKKPALPLRFIADVEGHESDPETLMGFVLGNRASGAIRVVATATADNYKLRVPIRTPHPLNPKQSSSGRGPGRGELIIRTKAETDDMAKTIAETMREDFKQNVSVTVERWVA